MVIWVDQSDATAEKVKRKKKKMSLSLLLGSRSQVMSNQLEIYTFISWSYLNLDLVSEDESIESRADQLMRGVG